ncbi:CBS domain-containing protein [Desulfonema magnum]|uniref:DHH and CBS domains-containing protein n=1 Tax=Desulfonema magnum TaxID=45655 RepID=A0A975GPB8_9BACT|nr:CBS domain-containing protein [Desulfonema magnum]QTA88677.1 DHH and CBS domains-containing protein [Desulfonema magnum]
MEIVTTHKNTDFDALASTIAATLLYPGTIPVLPKNINPNVKAFLSIHKDIFGIRTPDEIDLNDISRLVVVDINRWDRLDKQMDILKQKDDLEVILWDHHTIKGDINPAWKCREEMGANITLMVRQLRKKKMALTPIQATLFLTGLYEDTGNLRFPSTKSEDAYAAAYLLERNADLNILNSFLRHPYGEKQKNILFEMLKSAERTQVNGYKISINKLQIKGHVSSLSVVVQMYREIVNVDAAFGIFTSKNKKKCMVIGRANADSLNIGAIMRNLGGGGHIGAGSAILKSVDPDTVEETIKDMIEGHQQLSAQLGDMMSFPVFTVSPDTSMKEVAIMLREKGCTGVPVVADEKIVGIISRRDFQKLRKDSALDAPVKAFMTTNVMTIEPGKSPVYAARLMVKHDIGRLPVVENGRIIGIVTRSDAMNYFYDLLPE